MQSAYFYDLTETILDLCVLLKTVCVLFLSFDKISYVMCYTNLFNLVLPTFIILYLDFNN